MQDSLSPQLPLPEEYKPMTRISILRDYSRTFWTANLMELFERAAYYSMASFVVIYLGQLGLGDYWPSTLNGLLWTLIYFLPILSGTIADQVGFRRALLLACVLAMHAEEPSMAIPAGSKLFVAAMPDGFDGYHCCPATSRTESIGYQYRMSPYSSRMSEVPVEWAFSRTALG